MPKILVIDDDPSITLAVRLALTHVGYEVVDAPTAAAGLEAVKLHNPDLVILDVMMETHTAGFQVAHTLHNPDPTSEYARYRKLPILMLSAIHSTTPLRFEPEIDDLPVELFVDKPIDPEDLVRKVNWVLAATF